MAQRSDIYFTNSELNALACAIYAASSEGAVGEPALSAITKIQVEADARQMQMFGMPWGHGAKTPREWREWVIREAALDG